MVLKCCKAYGLIVSPQALRKFSKNVPLKFLEDMQRNDVTQLLD